MPETGRINGTTALILLAVSLGVMESFLPRPVPFMKLGLANLPAVIAAVRMGLKRTLAINTVRAFSVALITGSLATPAFLMSLSGAVASALAMAGVSRFHPRILSMTGVSICGACASMWSQLGTASLVIPGIPLDGLAIPVTIWGIGSGAVTGVLAALLCGRFLNRDVLSR